MSKKICRLEEGHNLVPLEYRLSAGKPFPQKPRKCCLPGTQASWWCCPQSTCVWSQSVPLQSMILRDPKLDICICDYRFEHEGVPNDTSQSVFQFIVRNSCIKGWKVERFERIKLGYALIYMIAIVVIWIAAPKSGSWHSFHWTTHGVVIGHVKSSL